MRTRGNRGTRLMTAGTIVTTIGVVVAVGTALQLPASWNPAMVGIGLIVAGALRRAVGSRDDDTRRSGRGIA